MDRRDQDPAAAARGLGLVIRPQTPVPHEPGQRPLHDPAFRQHQERALARQLGHDHELERVVVKRDLLEPAPIGCVGEDREQLGEARLGHLLQNLVCAIAVLHAGSRDPHGQDQSERVREEVSLASGDLLARVVSPAPPLFSATRTLWLSRMAALGCS